MDLIRLNRKIVIITTFALILVVVVIIIVRSSKKEDFQNPTSLSSNLFEHPVYSNYHFSQSNSVINIGIQPMYLPTGILFEVIKRDIIFNKIISNSKKEIKYQSFFKGADINFFLQQKILDGGIGGDMPAILASSNFDILIPVILQKGNVSIVSKKQMLTNSIKDKRIAFPYGSISHYFILDLLKSVEISESNAQLIPMDISSLADALDKNKIDLFSAWEPTVAIVLKEHPDFVVSYKRMSTGYLYFSRDFAQTNPEIIEHLLAAIIRSIAWMKSDRKNLLKACEWNILEIEKLTGKKSILNAEEIAILALKDILGYSSRFAIVIDKDVLNVGGPLNKEFEFLNSINIKMNNSNWNQVKESFDNKIITNILAHPNKFHLNDFDYELN